MYEQSPPKKRHPRLAFGVIGTLIVGAVIAGGILMGIELNERNKVISNTENDLYQTQHELLAEEGRNAELTSENHGLSVGLADAETRNADLTSVNDDLTADLTLAEARVGQLAQDLQGLDALNHTITADLTLTEARVGQLTQELHGLDALNDTITADLTLAEARVGQLTQDLQEANAVNATLVSDNESLALNLQASEASNRTLTVRKETLEADLSMVTERKETLEADLNRLTEQHRLLVSVAGDVDQLRAEESELEGDIEALEAEIIRLTAARAPLIVESSIGGFACTGSMEPKITCLDTATWLDNFTPEDIVVGTVISFEPVEQCDLDSDSVAHRVMDIKHEDGGYYFWPKGDANDEPDGCWIPEENVSAYIIELQKNVNPQNENLRNSVNEAIARLEAADDAQEAAWTAYAAKYTAYCGFGPESERTCYLSNSRIQELNRLFATYSRLFSDYERAYDYWECWDSNAVLASRYSGIGFAPTLRPCELLSIRICVQGQNC